MTGREIDIVMRTIAREYAANEKRCRDAMNTQGAQHYQALYRAIEDTRNLLTSRSPSMVRRRRHIVENFDRKAAELLAQPKSAFLPGRTA